jgi:hypothetical protein
VLVLTVPEHAAELAAALGPEAHLWPVPAGQAAPALARAAEAESECLVIDLDLGDGLAVAVAALRGARPALRVGLYAPGRSPGDPEAAAVARAGVFDVATDPVALAELLARPTDYAAGAAWLHAANTPANPAEEGLPAAAADAAPGSEPNEGRPAPAQPAAPTRHRIVAVASKKGGVGKSTVAANLAAAAARLEVDVLYVDLDPDTWSSEELFGRLGQRGGLTAALRSPSAESVLTSRERRYGLHVLARGREDGLLVQPEREAVEGS